MPAVHAPQGDEARGGRRGRPRAGAFVLPRKRSSRPYPDSASLYCIAGATLSAGVLRSARRQLYLRERGVCRLCGLDASALAKRLAVMTSRRLPPRGRVSRRVLGSGRAGGGGGWRPPAARRGPVRVALRPRRGGEGRRGRRTVENGRTLCVMCHKAHTAEQKKRWPPSGDERRREAEKREQRARRRANLRRRRVGSGRGNAGIWARTPRERESERQAERTTRGWTTRRSSSSRATKSSRTRTARPRTSVRAGSRPSARRAGSVTTRTTRTRDSVGGLTAAAPSRGAVRASDDDAVPETSAERDADEDAEPPPAAQRGIDVAHPRGFRATSRGPSSAEGLFDARRSGANVRRAGGPRAFADATNDEGDALNDERRRPRLYFRKYYYDGALARFRRRFRLARAPSREVRERLRVRRDGGRSREVHLPRGAVPAPGHGNSPPPPAPVPPRAPAATPPSASFGVARRRRRSADLGRRSAGSSSRRLAV